jgi:condensin complex subunit 2
LPEQKVNEKNSWNLDLINHLDRVIDEPSADGEGEMTNFQRASCTLEAGIKIYSSTLRPSSSWAV